MFSVLLPVTSHIYARAYVDTHTHVHMYSKRTQGAVVRTKHRGLVGRNDAAFWRIRARERKKESKRDSDCERMRERHTDTVFVMAFIT